MDQKLMRPTSLLCSLAPSCHRISNLSLKAIMIKHLLVSGFLNGKYIRQMFTCTDFGVGFI
jgi:hypothetical protein